MSMSNEEVEAAREALIWFVRTASSSRAANIAAWTFLVWDHIICLEQEVKLVWCRRWTFINILYILLRYGALGGLTFCVMGYMATNVTDTFCRAWILFQGYVGPLPWMLVEWVMITRVYALYERSTFILTFLCIGFIIQFVAIMAIWSLHHAYAMSFTGTPVPGFDFHICVPTMVSKWLYLWWLPPILLDTVICILVFYKGLSTYRRSGTGLIELILRDSLLYYIASVLVQFTTLVMWRVGNGVKLTQMQSGTLFAAATVIVLCCRMVLNLRDYSRQPKALNMSISVETTTDAYVLSPTPRDWNQARTPRGKLSIHVKSQTAITPHDEEAVIEIISPRTRDAPTYSHLGSSWPT